jgi:hypothetical protein
MDLFQSQGRAANAAGPGRGSMQLKHHGTFLFADIQFEGKPVTDFGIEPHHQVCNVDIRETFI